MKKISLLLAALTVVFVACNKSSDDSTGTTTTSTAETSAMTKAQAATAATATNSNGLTKGTSFVVTSSVNDKVGPLSTSFNAESDCAVSGWPASGSQSDVGYAMKFLMCSVLKRPDGPDTVRGGFDRITGFLCAIGDVTYDGTAVDKNVTISTTCFSQTFVTTACSYIAGTTSNGPCSGTMTITGYSSTSGVAPSSFDKYLTVSAVGGAVKYTIAHKISGTSVAGAIMGGLPTDSDSSITDAFSFYADSATGVLRYEGRFGGTNKRHMRINLQGTLNSNLEVTNVETLKFVQGENFSSGGGLIVSVSGTPAAGRRIHILNTSDMSVTTPTWSAANTDDNSCVGETGAACTSNTGITYGSDKKFFFATGSSFVSAKTWFGSNSYLGSVSNTVDMDDVWD